jgi:hypothetical protein
MPPNADSREEVTVDQYRSPSIEKIACLIFYSTPALGDRQNGIFEAETLTGRGAEG